MEKEKADGKEDVRNRLAAMATFAPDGCGFPKTSLAPCTYKRERGSPLRRGITDKARFWEKGLRVPLGNRVAQESAALTWCWLDVKTSDGNALLVADFDPLSICAYELFTLDSKKQRGTTRDHRPAGEVWQATN